VQSFERGTGMRITEIVRGTRAITTDSALCLPKAVGVDERLWINIQAPEAATRVFPQASGGWTDHYYDLSWS
jgi:hypothetical protein